MLWPINARAAYLLPEVHPLRNFRMTRKFHGVMNELRILRRTALKITAEDNVAVALTDLNIGEHIEAGGDKYTISSFVPAKHKFALKYLAAGDAIVMYGVVVGETLSAVPIGSVLGTANTRHRTSAFHTNSESYSWDKPDVAKWKDRTFAGYHRADGQVGTRNYWLVVPLVFCENRNIHAMKHAFEKELGDAAPDLYTRHVADMVRLHREGKTEELRSYKFKNIDSTAGQARLFRNIDGVKFLTHEMGCGGTRDDARTLCGLIAGYIHHPNVAGATILSLGCQNAQSSILKEEIHKRNPSFDKPLFIYDQQTSNLESTMLEGAMRDTFLGLIAADKSVRTPAPLSAITLGLKCGGSDGFSGISANPAIGHAADILAVLGGKGILSEFPELCGVEQNLIDRCTNRASAERLANLMRTYASRAEAIGSGFDMNPSPGNIKDGLITDGMKSAGAARKGGASPVTDVLDYPEYATKPGLNLLCTPGSDVEAVTAQVGAGANVVLFTTGLGTPTGNPIVPVVKISTNSELARRMHDIIDIDTGSVVQGELTIQQMGEQVLEQVIKIASGEQKTKAEIKVQEDFIPWKRGVSL
jgi:altronate hydrolase